MRSHSLALTETAVLGAMRAIVDLCAERVREVRDDGAHGRDEAAGRRVALTGGCVVGWYWQRAALSTFRCILLQSHVCLV